MGGRAQTGAATVEHAGLAMLIATLVIVAVAAAASGPLDGARDLGTTLARKLRCAAVGPGPCWRDPLTEAYGRPLAGAVRALAPAPEVRRAASGAGLLAVDFRTCRSESCALPGERFGLTASNRRVTAFVSVADRRPVDGLARISYWQYRPSLGWERLDRSVFSAEIAHLASTPLLETDVPVLVALETLPGANHFDFPAGEQPPWRWQVERSAEPLPGGD